MSGYNGVAVDLPTFLPPGNFAWAECKHSGHCSRIFGNPDITTCRLMDMLKYQTSGSWASIDQVSSTAPIEGTGHVLELWCSTALLQMHGASALHMSTYFTPGNPGQKQNHLSLLLLSPSISSLLQVTAAFPSLPWLCQGPCWAWRVGLLCHHLHQSPASPALNSHTTLRLQTKRSSCYCKCYHFIKCLAMFVVLVLELLEPENCVRIVTFHFQKNFFRLELCSSKNVNYLTIWLETIACPNT